jgi:hypothetical protein
MDNESRDEDYWQGFRNGMRSVLRGESPVPWDHPFFQDTAQGKSAGFVQGYRDGEKAARRSHHRAPDEIP